MFEPFRDNYVWNLSVNLALCMGGAIGEIDSANRVILSAAAEGEDAGTEAFFASWCALADRLAGGHGDPEAAARELGCGGGSHAAPTGSDDCHLFH